MFEALAATRTPWHYGSTRVSPFRWEQAVQAGLLELLRVLRQMSVQRELMGLSGHRVSRSKTRLKLDSWPPDSKPKEVMGSATGELLFQSDPARQSWSNLGTRCWTGELQGVPARGWWSASETLGGAEGVSGGATRGAAAGRDQQCCCSLAARGVSSVTGAR